jgi:hypothetical protein
LKKSFQYIFSFIVILSLLGLGENVIITCPNVKSVKDTEWIIKNSSNVKVSKCYDYHQPAKITFTNIDLHSWTNEFSISYNRILNVKFLSLAKRFYLTDLINLISNKLYIPRKSIEYHKFSSKRTDLSSKSCFSQETRLYAGNIMWNYLLTKKWINQGLNSSVVLMDLNILDAGFGNGFILS